MRSHTFYVSNRSFTSDCKQGGSTDMANWPGDHVGTSEKCAKPVVLDAYLQTLELWNRQRVNKLLGLQID